jgi:hypothetical protein
MCGCKLEKVLENRFRDVYGKAQRVKRNKSWLLGWLMISRRFVGRNMALVIHMRDELIPFTVW